MLYQTRRARVEEIVGEQALVAQVSALVDRFLGLRRRLQRRDDLKVHPTRQRYRPISDGVIAQWEEQHSFPLPEDYRIFLQLCGGIELAWEFTTRTASDEVVGGSIDVGGLPRRHSLEESNEFPQYKGLFYIWGAGVSGCHYCLRRQEGPATLVYENPNDSAASDLGVTFLGELREWVAWWGGDPGIHGYQGQFIPVGKDGQRTLKAMFERLVLRTLENPDHTLLPSLLRSFDQVPETVSFASDIPDECFDLLTKMAACGARAEQLGPRLTAFAKLLETTNHTHCYAQLLRLWRSMGDAGALPLARQLAAEESIYGEQGALPVLMRHGNAEEAAAARAALYELLAAPFSAKEAPKIHGEALVSAVETLLEDEEGRRQVRDIFLVRKAWFSDCQTGHAQQVDQLLAKAGIASSFRQWRARLDEQKDPYFDPLAWLGKHHARHLDVPMFRQNQRPEDEEKVRVWLGDLIEGIEAEIPAEELAISWVEPAL